MNLPPLPPAQRQALLDFEIRVHNKLKSDGHDLAAQWLLLAVIQPLSGIKAASRKLGQIVPFPEQGKER